MDTKHDEPLDRQRLGLRDTPIEQWQEESLGLGEYAEALCRFIRSCDTPLTISLQGDWGSGKTSLMNLIRQNIGTDPGVKTLWFNTWQYSQFQMAEHLPVSLISRLIDQLGGHESRNTVNKAVLSGLWKLGKAVAVGGASLVGQGDTVKDMASVLDAHDAKNWQDPTARIEQLKGELQNLVDAALKGNRSARLVIFIDDLDRLVPARAVELLECLKLFLDLPGCVYVLACDYQVIVRGLQQKFGFSEMELRGKSFFDKIIQLPFSMPTAHYTIGAYVERLLTRLSIEFEKEDVRQYVDLLDASVGFNPRTLKRLFNSLLLLRMVAQDVLAHSRTHALLSERMKTLFAVLCMQQAFEPLYAFLLRTDLDADILEDLRDADAVAESDLLEELRVSLNVKDDPRVLTRVARFMTVLFDVVQLRSDRDVSRLSGEEVEALGEILMLSRVVSTDANESGRAGAGRGAFRKQVDYFVEVLNSTYAALLQQLPARPRFTAWWDSTDRRSVSFGISLQWYDGEGGDATIDFMLSEHEILVGMASSKPARSVGPAQWLRGSAGTAFPGYDVVTFPDRRSEVVAEIHREGFAPDTSQDVRFERFKALLVAMLGPFLPCAITAQNEISRRPTPTRAKKKTGRRQ